MTIFELGGSRSCAVSRVRAIQKRFFPNPFKFSIRFFSFHSLSHLSFLLAGRTQQKKLGKKKKEEKLTDNETMTESLFNVGQGAPRSAENR